VGDASGAQRRLQRGSHMLLADDVGESLWAKTAGQDLIAHCVVLDRRRGTRRQ